MGFTTLEQEIFIKTSLLIDGVDIDPSACTEVGTKYAENIAWLFVFFKENKPDAAILPQNIVLPLGTCIDVRLSKKSPWLVRQVGDHKILEKNGKFITTVDFTRRPKYYGLKTSDGVDMRTVFSIRGRHGFDICDPLWCDCWTGDKSCKFCNMNPAHDTYSGTVALTHKKLSQVYETTKAYHEEVGRFHTVLTAGLPPKGHSTYPGMIKIIETMKAAAGLDRLPGIISVGPPDDFSEIEKLHETGIQFAINNIEIWDPDMFKAICPGKVRRYGGQEYYKKASDYTAKIFGRGNSVMIVVLGIETKDTVLEGCKIMAERGTWMLMVPWVPMVNSKFENHRAPEPEWFLDVMEQALEIYDEYLPEAVDRAAYFKDCKCPGCFDVGLHWDMVRKRNNITEEDGMPYVDGVSPWKGHQVDQVKAA